MLRITKLLVCFALVLAFGARAWAFSLLGPTGSTGQNNPPVAWQIPLIGYGLPGDIGGPLNLGEEYRWNTPVVTYAFDSTFLNYFGADGVTAVERAVAVFNNLTNASAMSPSLSEYPTDVTRAHFQAQSLGVNDLKSAAMNAIIEEMGLAQTERFTWTLYNRNIQTFNNFSITNYFVVQRSFDPVTLFPSAYVNGTLYTYYIQEYINPTSADAVEVPADPTAFVYTTVAGGLIGPGSYYTGLSRDDVGGLRYLLRPSNVNVERLLDDASVAITNTASQTLLVTTDLATLIANTENTTNTAAQVVARYPGILLTSTNSYLTNLYLTNITTFFTNYPQSPVAIYVTNISTLVVTNSTYTYGNVVTNSLFSNNTVIRRTIEVTLADGYTPGLGTLQTNITSTTSISNYPNGEVYVRPIALLDYQIISTQAVNVVTNTNILSSIVGNLFPFTNTASPQLLVSQDLALLTQRSYGTTLTPAQIQLLYPGILITRTNTRFTNVFTTNYVGSTSFVTIGIALVNDYIYGNVVTNQGPFTPVNVRTQLVEVVPVSQADYYPGGPLFVTNVLSSGTTTDASLTGGEFYIVPTNQLGFQFVPSINEPLLTNIVATTNVVFTNTNARFTNTTSGSEVLLTNIDLNSFYWFSTTNSAAQFVARFPTAYPGRALPLIISTSPYATNIVTYTITNFYTNFPGDPVGTDPTAILVTNYTTNIATYFRHTFANVVTNPAPNGLTNWTISQVTTQWVRQPGSPVGTSNFIAQVTTVTTNTREPNGSVYVFPTNLFGYYIASTNLIVPTRNTTNILTWVVTNSTIRVTNSISQITFTTNIFYTAYPIQLVSPTNVVTVQGQRRESIYFATNRIWWVYPIQLLSTPPNTGPLGITEQLLTLSTNTTLIVVPVVYGGGNTNFQLRRGIDKVTFQRVNFDSLLGQGFVPVTNFFTNSFMIVTNGTNMSQFVRRISTRPDFLFAGEDLGVATPTGGPYIRVRSDTSNWINENARNNSSVLAGPGVIVPQVRIAFNTIGPVYFNRTPLFLNQGSAFRFSVWGSFDGSTNPIVLFPSGTSISNLEQQVVTGP